MRKAKEWAPVAGIIAIVTFFVMVPAWMVTVMRGQSERHFAAVEQDGFKAGAAGQPLDACPHSPTYHQEDERRHWLRGWLAGERRRREEKVSSGGGP